MTGAQVETRFETKPAPEARSHAAREAFYPDNPVLVRVFRGGEVESQHRGAWVVCDSSGTIVDGLGSWRVPIFARSSVKCLQALPLLETGAAQRFDYAPAEVALALASHNAEDVHVDGVRGILRRIGLDERALQCGPQVPGDPDARDRLHDAGERPGAIHNNCSGKHAGFLALAQHLGVDPSRYLDPEHHVQRLVRKAVADMTGVADEELSSAIDGCSAPTFRMPLSALATAFARVANPDGLPALRRAACARMTDAVGAHPVMIAGRHQRICTDIARVTHGRLFPKVGSEAVYAIGVRGTDRALAIKIDDGNYRGMHPVIVELLRRFDFATKAEIAALEAWEEKRLTNFAGREVGRTEIAF